MFKLQLVTYSKGFIEHPHEFSSQEAENPHFAVSCNGGHFLAIIRECQTGGIRFTFGKLVQVCVCFILPFHLSGKLKLTGQTGPILDHPGSVCRHDDTVFRIEADLSQGG